MFCPKCGKENEDGSQFCCYCGTGFAAFLPPRQGYGEPAGRKPERIPEREKKSGEFKEVWIGVAALATLMGVLFGVIFIFSLGSQDATAIVVLLLLTVLFFGLGFWSFRQYSS